MTTRHTYSPDKNKYDALKNTNLKEIFFVRYADDFKILCRDYDTAQRIFSATRGWLKDRLRLEISPEKSKITNVRKGKSEFLGLKLFVRKKREEFIVRSNISDKAKTAIKAKLKGQIMQIQRETTPQQVYKLNSMILGIHNYYKMATLCSLDFAEINFIVSKSLHNRLKGRTKKVKGRIKKPEAEPSISKTFLKFYGVYKQKPKIVAGITIFPIYGCKFKAPLGFTQTITKYTEKGRELIHTKLHSVTSLVRHLLDGKEHDRSVEYNDNRISLMAGQNGKCGVTGKPLSIGYMHCHHKKPKEFGGTDEYKNLMWVATDVHMLIHATVPETIEKYLSKLKIDKKALKKVNSLRKLTQNLEIGTTTI